MESNSLDTRKIKIEMILPNWTGHFPNDCPDLDLGGYFDDRREHGLGLAVWFDLPVTANINTAIIEFLTPILGNAELLQSFSPVLHIIIYNYAYTCNIDIKCVGLLAKFGLELNINIYPTQKD
ncbi:hypothetical protein [Undibacterium sp. Ji49W]|uniref:hypothetical protein n=1 Tax=Undibacterium sp. Ji49W TaxID=3413040 RepID=UPI003BF19FF6